MSGTEPTDREVTEDQLDASPPASPDGGFVSDKGDAEERPDVLSAMAVYSGDGQVDDATGGDVAQVLMQPQEDGDEEPDRMPHGPA
jgi:hypothetical protein